MKTYPVRRAAALLALLMLGLLALSSTPARVRAQWDGCFPETAQCIGGRIREFWEQNGGLPVFGMAVGPQHAENIAGGTFQVQQFERNRLELHPENQRPYDVLLGRLGADAFGNQDWQTWPKGIPNQSHYFPQTGHNVPEIFWHYWSTSCLKLDDYPLCSDKESLALFGLPLTEATVETASDGQQYLTQWFERAKFEYHPLNEERYKVLLGRLGAEAQTVPFPGHFSYDISRANTHTIKFASRTTNKLTYVLDFMNGSLVYRKEGDPLNTPVITGKTSYQIADGIIVYFFEQNIAVDIEPKKWSLAQ